MTQPFSFAARFRSVGFALEGVIKFFRLEHNARIHLVATLAVIVAAVVVGVSRLEAIALTIVIGQVWIMEIINTAIERTVDFISEKKDTRIKIIKDLSAAAVLVTAIVAVVVGCYIFIPKL